MKIIDLLNKKANGEETPKKFKYDDLLFEEDKYGMYKDNEGSYLISSICYDLSNLNDVIEIIEDMQIEEYQKALDETMSEKIDLQYRIHKSIEYINSHIICYCPGEEEHYEFDYITTSPEDLLNILKGDKND